MIKNYIDSGDINFDTGLLKSPLERKFDKINENVTSCISLAAGTAFLYYYYVAPLANYIIDKLN